MKKKIFAILAVILCFSMLFVSCQKKEEEGEPEETKSNQEIILNYLNGEESNVGDIESTTYKMLSDLAFELTDIKSNGSALMNSVIVNNGVVYMNKGDSIGYVLFDESLSSLSLNFDSSEVSRAELSLADVKESEVDSEALTDSEITEADLIDEGNGVYSISRQYLNKSIEAMITNMAGEKKDSEGFADTKATIMGMVENMDISLKLTVADSEIVKYDMVLNVPKSVCKELFTKILGMPDIDGEYYIKETISYDLVDGMPKKLTATVDSYLPNNMMSSNVKNGVGVIFTTTDADITLDLTTLDDKATIIDVKILGKSNIKGYVIRNEKYHSDSSVTDDIERTYGSLTSSSETTVSLKAGEFAFTASSSNGSDTETRSTTAAVKFVETEIPQLNDNVKAYVTKAEKVFDNLDKVKADLESVRKKVEDEVAANYSTVMANSNISYYYGNYDMYVTFSVTQTAEDTVAVEIEDYLLVNDTDSIEYFVSITGDKVQFKDNNGYVPAIPGL